MKAGIVIVNYNQKTLLRNCLKSVQKIEYKNFVTLVVDNGSSDGSMALIQQEFQDVNFLSLDYNSGFCIANNLGIKRLLESGCDLILLLNNDTEVDSRFLGEMVRQINKKERIGMVSPRILFYNNKDIVDSAGIEITSDGLAKNRGLGEKSEDFQEAAEVFCPAGAAALFSRELLVDIRQNDQFLDEDYSFYFEELDLGWRARLRGWKCAYAPEAVVFHHKSATAGAYSKLVAYYTNRNVFYNIVKNYPFFFMWRALFFSVIRYPLLLGGFIFERGPGYKIKNRIGVASLIAATVKGWRDFLIKLPTMLKKRRQIQKRSLVTKKEVKRWFGYLGIPFLKSVYK